MGGHNPAWSSSPGTGLLGVPVAGGGGWQEQPAGAREGEREKMRLKTRTASRCKVGEVTVFLAPFPTTEEAGHLKDRACGGGVGGMGCMGSRTARVGA